MIDTTSTAARRESAGLGRSGQLDRSKAFKKARRHTWLVRSFKLTLPVLALFASSLYAVYGTWHISFDDKKVSVENIELSSDKLTMTKPRLEGVTKDNAQYVVEAATATQIVAHPDNVILDQIDATMTQPDGDWSKLTSNTGTFNTKTEKLLLKGDIRFFRKDGLKGRMTQASVNFRPQTVVSKHPVLIEMLNGHVTADTMELSAKNRIVKFNGQVRVHLKKRPERRESAKAAGNRT